LRKLPVILLISIIITARWLDIPGFTSLPTGKSGPRIYANNGFHAVAVACAFVSCSCKISLTSHHLRGNKVIYQFILCRHRTQVSRQFGCCTIAFACTLLYAMLYDRGGSLLRVSHALHQGTFVVLNPKASRTPTTNIEEEKSEEDLAARVSLLGEGI